jgi:hypothetical protein
MGKKLLAMGVILGLAACGGGEDEVELDEGLDTELEQPAPATPAPMTMDTMMADTMMMDSMMSDSMDHDTMGM